MTDAGAYHLPFVRVLVAPMPKVSGVHEGGFSKRRLINLCTSLVQL